MATAYIALGSNLGNRAGFLKSAAEKISRLPKTKMVRCSSWYETEPVGGPPQGKFLNGAAKIETSLKPLDLFDRLQQIERDLGRKPGGERWGAREIDLDLLDYDGVGLKLAEVELPHPRMHERFFVLAPLAEIEPQWKHPILEETVKTLLVRASTSSARTAPADENRPKNS